MERTERIALLHGLLTRKLLMDVQRYGADAEIIAPAELREQMRGMLAAALGRYAG